MGKKTGEEKKRKRQRGGEQKRGKENTCVCMCVVGVTLELSLPANTRDRMKFYKAQEIQVTKMLIGRVHPLTRKNPGRREGVHGHHEIVEDQGSF